MLVALLFANHDKQLAFKNLEWMDKIRVGDGHNLLIVCPSGVSEQDAERALSIGKLAFTEATLYHIHDDCDTGWPFGPNFMFRRTVDYISHFKLWPFLLLESDAWLLCEDSLDVIEAEYEKAVAKGKVFMGYKENEGKSGEHMNGVAVYGDINQHAPTALSAPWPQDRSQIGQNHMAFDMAGAAEIVPMMHNSRLFQFQYKQEERLLQDTSLSFLNPDAKIFHTDKTGRLVELLQSKRNGVCVSGLNVSAKAQELSAGRGLTAPVAWPEGSTPSTPTTDIFIKTYSRDAQWNEKCKDSIQRYCTGFRQTVENWGEHENGYLHQQVVKLNADRYTDADFILVTDSDTLFTTKVTPATFMQGELPKWHLTPRSEVLAADPGTQKWFDCMEKFLGVKPEHEFMRRQPFFFPRWLLQSFRQFCLTRHGCSVEEYVMRHQHFSEWNCLGFFAHTYHRQCFEWVDNSEPLVVKQFWSPHNQSDQNRQRLFDDALPEINRILGIEEKPLPQRLPVIKPADGWNNIKEPTARMDLAGDMLKKQAEEAEKTRKMKERMAKARAARKPKAVSK